MDEDKIDASVGLAFSLELFKLRKLSGTLQAELHRVSGVPRHSTAILEIDNGIVVSCFLMDNNKRQRNPITKEILIQLDNEKGPFEWSFQQSKTARTHTHDSQPEQRNTQVRPIFQRSVTTGSDTFIPRIVAQIDWYKLNNWTPQQRQALYMVWQLIDGKRTVQHIKDTLRASHPPALVDEALRMLQTMKVIMITP